MTDLNEELRRLFTTAKEAAKGSREQARDMRAGMKISRKIVKACMALQKAANRDEKKVKPGELFSIKADLATGLKGIDDLVNEMRVLAFVGRDEIVNRLDLATYQMREEFARNWPEFEKKVMEHG